MTDGDLSPQTAAGRTFFIVYGMIGVPVLASLLLQAATNAVGVVQRKKFDSASLIEKYGESALMPHHEMVKHHRASEDFYSDQKKFWIPQSVSILGETPESEVVRNVLLLEAHSRSIMLQLLPPESHAHILLQADLRNQVSTLRNLLPESEFAIDRLSQIAELGREDEVMDLIQDYRKTFAKFLVNGSELLALTGRRRHILERAEIV